MKSVLPIIVVLALASYLVPPHLTPWNYPADDSFFYLQVAAHIADGHGSTFNQITRTNGYHPLWMPVCVLSDFLAGGRRDLALHIAIGIQQLLGLASVWMLFRMLTRLGISSAFAIFPALTFFSITRIYLSEAYINLFFMSGTLAAASAILLHAPRASARHFAGAGVLGGLMILSRLDNLFTAGTIIACLLVFHARIAGYPLFSARTCKQALAAGLCVIAVLAPYLALNYISFGHLMPISGAIKNAAGGGLGFHWDGVSPMGRLFALFTLVGAVLVIQRNIPAAVRGITAGLATGYLVLIAYIVFLTRHHTDWPWYYTGGAVMGAMTGAMVLDRLITLPFLRSISRAQWTGLALLACVVMNSYASARFLYPGLVYGEGSRQERMSFTTRWQEDLGRWLKKELPADSRIIVYDWPGIVAYASEQAILAPDGLMNDFDYNRDILREGIGPYLASRGVQYWLGPCTNGATADQYWYEVRHDGTGADVEIIAPLLLNSAGSFRVESASQIIRFRDVLSNPETPDIGLWKIQ